MTIDEAVAMLTQLSSEVSAYRVESQEILEGAASLQTSNVTGVSSSTLKLEVDTYNDVVRKASTVITDISDLITSLNTLKVVGYPEQPTVPPEAGATEDLMSDVNKMEKAIAQLQLPGATAVVGDEVGAEQPVGR